MRYEQNFNYLPSFVDFNSHGSRDNVTGSQILSYGSVTFHEAFAFAVDKVSAFTSAAFSNQTSSSIDSCVKEVKELGSISAIRNSDI